MDFVKRGLDERVNELRRLLMFRNYSKAIRLSLAMYNDINFNYFDNESKYTITYDLAYCYRKKGINKAALSFLKISKQYVTNDDQGFYRILWMINECEISLGIDDKNKIYSRYVTCIKYYKSINSRLLVSYLLYNIAKYKKLKNSMFRSFLMVLKETKVIIHTNNDYLKSENVKEILNDMKKLDYNLYLRANNYLKMVVYL